VAFEGAYLSSPAKLTVTVVVPEPIGLKYPYSTVTMDESALV
jgi:hypothetical protein